MALKVALLRSDGPHHKYLEMLLNQNFCLACVAVEPAKEQVRRLRLRKRWSDWLWRVYHDWRRELSGLNRYRREYFRTEFSLPSSSAVTSIVVPSINHVAVADMISAEDPDVVVVIGTSILSKRLLKTAGTFINIHGGLLPFYRGNHCFFFACYDQRPDLAGSTIHFVDSGVDTGDIIATVTVPSSLANTPESMYCVAEKSAIQRLVTILNEFENGVPIPRTPQSDGGRTIRTRDRKPHHELIYFFRRIGLGHFPRRIEND